MYGGREAAFKPTRMYLRRLPEQITDRGASQLRLSFSLLGAGLNEMPQNDCWMLPEGIQESLPEEAARLELLRRRLLDLFDSWGYELVMPPFIEFIDSLLVGTGHDLDLQTFKLTDQVSGRMLGIRADMTPQVARIDAHNLKTSLPTRLCYIGTVLHTRADPLEKTRSPLQVGAELYGHAGVESDFEIVQLMLESLSTVGIRNIHIDLGHVGIFRGLAQQAGLSESQECEVFDVMQRKAFTELDVLLEKYGLSGEIRKMLQELPRLNGSTDIVEIARKKFESANQSVKDALLYLETLRVKISDCFPELPINFDLAELRGYHYQTGVVFAAFVPGYGREIARGGRYDEIGKVFGRARPATGFSADVKVLANLSQSKKLESEGAIFAPSEDDSNLSRAIAELRRSGRRVIQQLPGQLGTVEEMSCQYRLVKEQSAWVVVTA